MKKRALAYLKRDRVLYMGMISPIARNTADILHAGQDGVFMKETGSGIFMLSMDNDEKATELIERQGKPPHICVYEKHIADYLFKKFPYQKYVENYQAAYIKTERAEINPRFLHIHPLTIENLDWVYGHYFDQLDYNYLKKRIMQGAIYGGEFNGALCGFVGVHTEGSIGILKILEEFRGRGFALELERFMVNALLDTGKVPYSQIEKDNDASINLHKKAGFEISKRTLYRLIE